MEITKLIITGLLPALFAIVFHYAEKNTRFGKCSYIKKQFVIGIVFGGLAVLATEFSIDIGGAGINVRDAAPLTAGLLFGGPAGIIAGLIGAVERWFASLWGVGTYTRLACTLATAIAGFLAAVVRKFLLDDKKASWIYGMAVGVTMEVFHMLLIFMTNMSDLYQAFTFVRRCAIPMILVNGLAVMLAALCVSLVSKENVQKDMKGKKISQTFQLWLMVCVSIGFFVTCTFAFVIQNRIAHANAEELLRINMQDVKNDIEDILDGYDVQTFQNDIDNLIVQAAKNRHIGQNGCVMICDEEWTIVSDRDGHDGKHLSYTGLWIDILSMEEDVVYEADVYQKTSFWMYTKSEGYYIISMIPKEEVLFSRQVTVHILLFMEIVVFAALFACIYFLIKRIVVENIEKVNQSLSEITAGNLDVVVDVRSNEEFASLSDDINSTVVTLKRYIDEAAARIDGELEFAKTIQHSSLPSVFPPYPNRSDFDIYAMMDTAKEVGGDFYDFYLINENELVFLIADVSGKGIPAAMFMMKAKTMIKSLAESGMDVAQVFAKANEYLCEGNEANMFVTCWIGILDLRTGHLSYANAGHNPPLLRRKNGDYEYIKVRPNFVLAGMEGVRYRKHELWLYPGDSIYLYTDGVTEAQDKEQTLFGENRLVNSLNESIDLSVEEICRKIKSDVDTFVGETEQFDDMTMLVLKLNAIENSNVLSVKPDRESLSQVSDFMDERLEEMKIPIKLCSKLKIVTDEIYSNIVFYSHAAKAEVKCSLADGKLILVFIDDGIPYNPLHTKSSKTTGTAEEREIGGLGVMIVRSLMDQMEYEYADGQNRLTLIKTISM